MSRACVLDANGIAALEHMSARRHNVIDHFRGMNPVYTTTVTQIFSRLVLPRTRADAFAATVGIRDIPSI